MYILFVINFPYIIIFVDVGFNFIFEALFLFGFDLIIKCLELLYFIESQFVDLILKVIKKKYPYI